MNPEDDTPPTEEQVQECLDELVTEGRVVQEIQPDRTILYFARERYQEHVQKN